MTEKSLGEMKAHNMLINALVSCPNNPRIFASASSDKTFKVWDLKKAEKIGIIKAFDEQKSELENNDPLKELTKNKKSFAIDPLNNNKKLNYSLDLKPIIYTTPVRELVVCNVDLSGARINIKNFKLLCYLAGYDTETGLVNTLKGLKNKIL